MLGFAHLTTANCIKIEILKHTTTNCIKIKILKHARLVSSRLTPFCFMLYHTNQNLGKFVVSTTF